LIYHHQKKFQNFPLNYGPVSRWWFSKSQYHNLRYATAP